MAKRIIKAKPEKAKAISKAIKLAENRSLESYKNLCFVCDNAIF